nr:reverse transcriptase domain-containing protein [Tanacetum cinerariifolium]
MATNRPPLVLNILRLTVRKFYFLTDFVVVDFEADTRVPLILGRSVLRTGRALIDVYEEEINLQKVVAPAPIKAVEESCVTCGGAHTYYNCPNTDINQPSVYVATVQQGLSNEFLSYKNVNDQMMRNMQNQINSLKGEFKNEIQNIMKTQQTVLMEQQNAFQNNLQNMLSRFFQEQSSTSGTLPSNTIPNPKGRMKAITTRNGVAYDGPSILTPKKVVERETNETTDKEQSNFQESFAHIQPPVTLIPKPDSLLTNKDKLFELAKIPLNENCSAMLLKKLPEKLGDPGKFLIPCDFSGMDVCCALADLELADRSITRPKEVAEDVFVKVRKFLFLTDFVVVDFEADPCVPLILGRSFLRTGRALIDVYREEITLQEILGFSSNSSGGNPTSTFEHILSDSSHSLTPFEGSDFILEEIDAYLKDESISLEINHADYDPEGDICLIEKLLNDDPFQLPPMDLKQGEVVKAKSLIEEPSKLELKELPSHLEYAYLEGEDKLPVMISKDLKVDEKEALLKVLKSYKKAIAWKITDIKGIDPRFCTHKILMEEDYKPAVQSQRRVNPKIHEVIKKEVIKLLDAVENENNELIPTRLVTRWRVCIDYRKLNDATRKDHFPLSFMDQMLERLARNEFYCFLDGFSGYFQIPINPPDQEKTTFTCPYGTFAYRRMPFGLCNAPGTFQSYKTLPFGLLPLPPQPPAWQSQAISLATRNGQDSLKAQIKTQGNDKELKGEDQRVESLTQEAQENT